jgi:hypothetical protein
MHRQTRRKGSSSEGAGPAPRRKRHDAVAHGALRRVRRRSSRRRSDPATAWSARLLRRTQPPRGDRRPPAGDRGRTPATRARGCGSHAPSGPRLCLKETRERLTPSRRTVAQGVAQGRLTTRNAPFDGALLSTATGIRTPVSAVRGRRPSPLDDGGSGPDEPSNPSAIVGPSLRADVAELVDAHGSGPCGGNSVEVRVLSSAFEYESPAMRGFLLSGGSSGPSGPQLGVGPKAYLVMRRPRQTRRLS